MKPRFSLAILLALAARLFAGQPLFDGKTLHGWEGDTSLWKVADGMIVGGDVTRTVPRNEFLASVRQYTNFALTLKFKLEGTEGFVNSGVQLRSQRVPGDSEMNGYQADIGEGWYGCLYDESRRNRVLARPDETTTKRAVKPAGEWNSYEIRCVGRRISVRLNGVLTVDYTEPDTAIPQFGRLGLQLHGGGKTRVTFKDLEIEELP